MRNDKRRQRDLELQREYDATDRRIEDWLVRYEYKRSESRGLRRLIAPELRPKRDEYDELGYDHIFPPRDDHPITLRRGRDVCGYLSQPYGPLSMSDMIEILDFCSRYGLDCSVSGESPWFPGYTIALLYTRRERKSE